MQKILSQFNQLDAKPDAEEINLRFLRALPSSWFQVSLTLKTKGGLEFLSFDDLCYKLKTLEVDIKGYSTFSPSQFAGPSHATFLSFTSTSKMMPYGDSLISSSPTTYSVPSNSNTGKLEGILTLIGRNLLGLTSRRPDATSVNKKAIFPGNEDHMPDFHHYDDARDIWMAVKSRFGGNEESKKMRKTMLKQQFTEFSVTEEEGLHKGFDRFQKILSQLNQVQARPDNDDINMKFLRALPSSWSQVALALKTRGGLESMSFDDLYNKLRSLELDVRIGHNYGVKAAAPIYSAFVGASSSGSKPGYYDQQSIVPIVSQTSGRSDNI
nr:ribonuclease H-like domain-containing protein [Tanacetum cinerariifolium]